MTGFLTNDRIFDMKLFVFLTITGLLALPQTADCQLPTADSLHAALDSAHARKLAATLAEFDDAGPPGWMNWTPSVGMGYNLQGEPRPTMSFSLSQVIGNIERRKERKAKRRAIEEAGKLELSQLHSQLDAMLQRYAMLSLELETMRQVFSIDSQLHDLAAADYEAARLSPVQFLPKEKAFLEEKLKMVRKEMEVKAVEGDVLGFVGFR